MTSRALAIALTGFAALGAAVVGAFLHERLQPEARAPAVARAAATAAAPPDAVPPNRPVIALADLSGRTHSITEWDGKALVVNFWATWCAPCRREIPLLNQIQREYAAKGVEVVGIAVDVASDVKAFTAQVPIDYPLLVGEQDGVDAARDFGVPVLAFPFTAFTDAKGRMISVHLGELHESTARAMLDIIQRLGAGTITLAEARAAARAAEAAAAKAAAAAGG